jgi:regulator of RNase E activity RraB
MLTEESYRLNLARQLAMNEKTWARLLELGITGETEVQLDFLYYASNEAAAALQAFLKDETDYEVDVHPETGSSGQWIISGRTQKTTISKEILDQWVEWMVAAGFEHQCEFDGWGTSV